MLRLLFLNLRADRDRPPLERLAAIDDPERFLWEILPHAARTFSLCIIALPRRMARPVALAYLYGRMLDSFEDIAPTAAEKDAKLAAFVDSFPTDGNAPGPAPTLDDQPGLDARDRSHLLLVRKCALLDRLYVEFPLDQRLAIRRMVQRMGDGMRWATATFAEQSGVLRDSNQLSTYCHHVLGTPILFAEEIARLDRGMSGEVVGRRAEVCLDVGELVQLANVTRDLAKDVDRGVCYHPALAGKTAGPERDAAIRRVRTELLARALECGRAVPEFFEGIPSGRFSLARGAAWALILFTWGFYQGLAERSGWQLWDDGFRMTRWRAIGFWLRSVLSRRWLDRDLQRWAKRVDGGWERAQRQLQSDRESEPALERSARAGG